MSFKLKLLILLLLLAGLALWIAMDLTVCRPGGLTNTLGGKELSPTSAVGSAR